jgi:hypothetical protein
VLPTGFSPALAAVIAVLGQNCDADSGADAAALFDHMFIICSRSSRAHKMRPTFKRVRWPCGLKTDAQLFGNLSHGKETLPVSAGYENPPLWRAV